ncbi:ABC transporter [Escherichia coli]|nr:ABC transporter [Escherichia coli]
MNKLESLPISSQADSLIKISRIWADFFPANTSNQPI